MKKLCLFLFLIVSSTLFPAVQLKQLPRDFDLSLVDQKIQTYLDEEDIAPWLRGKDLVFQRRGLTLGVFKTSVGLITFFEGAIIQESTSYRAIFKVLKQSDTKEVHVDLLFFTNRRPISIQLYHDIMNFPGLWFVVNADDIFAEGEKVHCYIETLSPNGENSSQRWHFYRGDIDRSCIVRMNPDGQGGTYFSVERG